MENLIYIVLGIIFFIVQVYRESEKVKKKSRTSDQEPHSSEGRNYEENFPAKENEKKERDTAANHKRSPEARSGHLKNAEEKKDKLSYHIEYSEKAGKKPAVKKENESLKNSDTGKITSSNKKTGSDNDYAGMFETSQSVRSAFIASEIFNRKHF